MKDKCIVEFLQKCHLEMRKIHLNYASVRKANQLLENFCTFLLKGPSKWLYGSLLTV